MNVILIAIGSAGDVHPFLGIGAELLRRGHRVTFVTNGYFEPQARRAGFDFIPLHGPEEYHEVTSNPDLWNPRRAFKVVMEFGVIKPMRLIYDILAEWATRPDTVVVAAGLAMGARIAQDKLGFPMATVQLQPAVLRTVHDAPIFAGLGFVNALPRFVKRALYRYMDFRVDGVLCPTINAFRAELGLPPLRRVFADWWLSPQRVIGMFPEWFAATQPDWPPQLRLTGFPLYDAPEGEALPEGLRAFLDGGEPPIIFTPGSAMRHGREFFSASIDACRRMGRRALLLTRHREQLPEPLPDFAAHFDYVPLGEVLPCAAVLVHHGGIGTLAQGLRAGVPQIVMPMAHDQYDNASRLRRLGAGASIPVRRFRADALADVLRFVLTDRTIADACRRTAERFMGDAPIVNTCDRIERDFERCARVDA